MQGTIQKWGNSHAVRLPKNLIDSAGLQENDLVEIISEKDQLTIKKKKRHLTLEERFQDYQTDTSCVEFDWGSPQGEELW